MRKSRSISSRIAIGIGAVALTLLAQQSNQPRPTCQHCRATYVPVSELDAYTAKAARYGIVDQQVRSVDVGRSQVGVAMVTRRKLVAGTARKGAVAEHEQVSEVYHIIEGTATLLTGPDLVNVRRDRILRTLSGSRMAPAGTPIRLRTRRSITSSPAT
jgi:mannose-6-phosphate isomerase-like protein (cupin superfamily)